VSTVLRDIEWSHIPAGDSMLAMHIFAQARIDLEDDKPRRELGYRSRREDALSFLRGEEDEEGEEMLTHWCECAGIDPHTVMAMVRHEPTTLLERLTRKARGREIGSYISVTVGELKAAKKTGATPTEQVGVWRWREWLVVKEGHGFPASETSNGGEVFVGRTHLPFDGDEDAGVRGQGEEANQETQEETAWQ
jgi:hypothetical protein